MSSFPDVLKGPGVGMRHSWMATIFWLAAAFTLVMALLPHPPELPGHPGDKIQHVLAFATLTGLALFTYRRAHFIVLFACLSAFGGIIELLQAFPAFHRDADIRDWFTDSAAILVVISLFLIIPPMLASGMRKADRAGD